MRCIRLKVMRDTNSVYNVCVPPWEQPVLEAIFPTGSIQPTDDFEDVEREYPEAGIEFDRLATKYGSDRKTGTPFVAMAYGTERGGMNALEVEIAKAREADEARERTEPSPAPVRRGRARASTSAADPLLA